MLFLRRDGQEAHSRRAGNDSGEMLQHAKRGGISAGHHEAGDERGLAKCGTEEFGEAGPLESSLGLLSFPDGGFRQERAQHDQGNGGNQAGHGGIAPGSVAAVDQGQALAIGHGDVISGADQQASGGGKALRISDNGFAAFAVRK